MFIYSLCFLFISVFVISSNADETVLNNFVEIYSKNNHLSLKMKNIFSKLLKLKIDTSISKSLLETKKLKTSDPETQLKTSDPATQWAQFVSYEEYDEGTESCLAADGAAFFSIEIEKCYAVTEGDFDDDDYGDDYYGVPGSIIIDIEDSLWGVTFVKITVFEDSDCNGMEESYYVEIPFYADGSCTDFSVYGYDGLYLSFMLLDGPPYIPVEDSYIAFDVYDSTNHCESGADQNGDYLDNLSYQIFFTPAENSCVNDTENNYTYFFQCNDTTRELMYTNCTETCSAECDGEKTTLTLKEQCDMNLTDYFSLPIFGFGFLSCTEINVSRKPTTAPTPMPTNYPPNEIIGIEYNVTQTILYVNSSAYNNDPASELAFTTTVAEVIGLLGFASVTVLSVTPAVAAVNGLLTSEATNENSTFVYQIYFELGVGNSYLTPDEAYYNTTAELSYSINNATYFQTDLLMNAVLDGSTAFTNKTEVAVLSEISPVQIIETPESPTTDDPTADPVNPADGSNGDEDDNSGVIAAAVLVPLIFLGAGGSFVYWKYYYNKDTSAHKNTKPALSADTLNPMASRGTLKTNLLNADDKNRFDT